MRKHIAWKRRLGRIYALLNARNNTRKLILIYHSIGGGSEATSIEVFRNHLKLITETAQLIALHNIIETHPAQTNAVAVTFDDGYATLRDHAASLVAEFGGAPTVFLNVSEIADVERRSSNAEDGYYSGEQFMTWRDVDVLRAKGWHIGSHGMRHLDLVNTDLASVQSELSDSKTQIEHRLGTTCDMFAYPWGRNDSTVREQVRASGYRYGFSGHHSPLSATSDPLALPRINMAKEYERDDLAAILRGDWDYLHWLAKAKAVMG